MPNVKIGIHNKSKEVGYNGWIEISKEFCIFIDLENKPFTLNVMNLL